MVGIGEAGPAEEVRGPAYGFRVESKTSRHRVLAIDRGLAGRQRAGFVLLNGLTLFSIPLGLYRNGTVGGRLLSGNLSLILGGVVRTLDSWSRACNGLKNRQEETCFEGEGNGHNIIR